MYFAVQRLQNRLAHYLSNVQAGWPGPRCGVPHAVVCLLLIQTTPQPGPLLRDELAPLS
jgi:hypothetical protein